MNRSHPPILFSGSYRESLNYKESCMKIHMSGSMAHMDGNWTLTGVTQSSIKSLSVALQQIEHCDDKTLRIDCRHVTAIDTTGKQLLDVWMQCARFRGADPVLVNPPVKLKRSFQGLGLTYSYTDSSQNSAGHKYPSSNHRKRRFKSEVRRYKGNCQTASN